jgi:hypothetical protein
LLSWAHALRNSRIGEATLELALDHAEYYRRVSAGHVGAIRASDLGARIVMVFLRTAPRTNFQFADATGREVSKLQMRSAILPYILFWKTRYLQISFTVCSFSVFAATGFI